MRSLESRPASFLGVLVAFGVAGSLAGCSSIEPVAPHGQPIVNPAELYMGLTLDHPAVNLSTAPGSNTLQLTATPRDALGNPMSGLPAPTFRMQVLGDTTRVRVTPNGLLTAVGNRDGVKVIASLTVGLVTFADTAWINVRTPASLPVLDTLSVRPLPPDSATWSISGDFNRVSLIFLFTGLSPTPMVSARAVTPTGVAITGLQVEYRSLDPAIATVDRRTGLTTPIRTGQARIVARTVAYGVVKADTATFTVTPRTNATVSWSQTFDVRPPKEIRIAPYGVVGFANSRLAGEGSLDVTFDNPTNVVAPPASLAPICSWPNTICGAGDLLLMAGATESFGFLISPLYLRQFPVPGVYRYRGTYTDTAGVVVHDSGRVVVTTELN